jgi:hypothetical protein
MENFSPPLRGDDARTFLDRMHAAAMTEDRLNWLRSISAESKKAEKPTK